MAKQVVFVVDPQGQVRHLVGELPPALLDALGPVKEIYRNSHVESTRDLRDTAKDWLLQREQPIPRHKWWADMLPVGGPVLGPFNEYMQALAAEVTWLQEHHLPQRHERTDPSA